MSAGRDRRDGEFRYVRSYMGLPPGLSGRDMALRGNFVSLAWPRMKSIWQKLRSSSRQMTRNVGIIPAQAKPFPWSKWFNQGERLVIQIHVLPQVQGRGYFPQGRAARRMQPLLVQQGRGRAEGDLERDGEGDSRYVVPSGADARRRPVRWYDAVQMRRGTACRGMEGSDEERKAKREPSLASIRPRMTG